ncbi:MAG: methyl-accepting chemotaxis protein [Synergistaceae bacterium]|jgi:methyl-accepting chemotaxis protein|nr:methyl-accepting chemotaxis protein [Synergistaceae bacterium]
MWKNLKTSAKLLLGFGLVLAVFSVAVAVTWNNLTDLRENNRYLDEAVVPSMAITSRMEREVYDLFVAVDSMQLLESEDSIKAIDAAKAPALKTLDDAASMWGTYPQLLPLQNIDEKVSSPLKSYVQMLGTLQDAFRKKNASFKTLAAAGAELADMSGKLVSDLFGYAKKEAITGGITERHIEILNMAQDITTDLLNIRYTLLRQVSNNDVNEIPKILDESAGKVEKAIQTVRSAFSEARFRNAADQLLEKLPEYKKLVLAFVDDFKAIQKDDAERAPIVAALSAESSAASKAGQDSVSFFARENLSSLGSSITILIIAAILAILTGFAVALLISRSITKPLSTIVDMAKRAEGGDLTIGKEDFRYEGKDELGSLVSALANMIAAQEETVRHVVNVSGKLSYSAGNLSTISEETNASMEEVKASIDVVSALSERNGAALEQCNTGVEEMSAGADTVAQSASESADFISNTTNVSHKAIQTVNGVIAGMRNVDRNAKESENKTRQLVSSVENVSSFVSVITGIADQTNLLALNAAIEAARAGEAGRGFAVVADEVRKLSEESARAAQNVDGIIIELQKGAHESIAATSEAGRTLVETLVQAEQAHKELTGTLEPRNKANDSIQNIAAVAQEQAAASKGIAAGIDSAAKSTREMVDTITNIRHAADETASAAQGVAEQSEAMNRHAETLTDVLSRFKVHKQSEPKALAARS